MSIYLFVRWYEVPDSLTKANSCQVGLMEEVVLTGAAT